MMGNQRQSSQEHKPLAPIFAAAAPQDVQAAPGPYQQLQQHPSASSSIPPHSPLHPHSPHHPLPLSPHRGSGGSPGGYHPSIPHRSEFHLHQQQQHGGVVGPSCLLRPSSGSVATHLQQLSPHHHHHLPQHHPHPQPQPHPNPPSVAATMLEQAPHPQFSKWQQLPPRPPPTQAGGFGSGPPGGQHGYIFPEGVPPHQQLHSSRGVTSDQSYRHPSGTLSADHSPHRQPVMMDPEGSPRSPHTHAGGLHAEFHHLREGASMVPDPQGQRMQAYEAMELQHQQAYGPGQQGSHSAARSVPSGHQPARRMDLTEWEFLSQPGTSQHQQRRFPHGQPAPHQRPAEHGDVHTASGYHSPGMQVHTDCGPSACPHPYPNPRPPSDPPVFHIQSEEEGEGGGAMRSVPVIQGGEMEGQESWGAGGEGSGGVSAMAGPSDARPRLWCGADQKEDEAISDSDPSVGPDDYDDDSSPELSPRLPKSVCRLRLTRSTHQDADPDSDAWGQEGTSGGKRGTGDFDPGEDLDEPLAVSEGERSPSGFHPSKFKKRLHERYVSSLQSGSPVRGRGNSEERTGAEEGRGERGGGRGCRSEGDNVGHPLPSDAREVRACDTPDNDVFMDASPSGSLAAQSDPGCSQVRSRPPALGESEPLDLSQATLPPPPAGLSPHSPGLSPDLTASSPGGKPFSPVNFRSPHRLPYPSHGLLSPQSPLCSVPEGGRIFNFNVPSPFEGPHSDSDLLSPSPMSPRIFQFPPHGSMLNTMSEVNRLAVSPRALYPSAGSVHPSAQGRACGGPMTKDENTKGYYEKRSLSESDVTYLCPICGQVFPAYDNLAKHMAKHLPTETVRAGDNNKIHYCKVCNRSFSRSDMLTRHMRLHTGLKPYECADCGQVFSRSDHLNTHRRTHTGEKPYRCPHCPYAACRRDMITRHMRTHAKRSVKRGRFLSVPEPEPSEVRKSSVSSTETTDSQDQSVRTCSVSSVESADSESHHRSSTDPSGSTGDDPPAMPSAAGDGPWITPKQEQVDPMEEDHKPVFGTAGSLPEYDPFSGYRKPRNWSVTSVDSVTSEDLPHSRHDSVADDTFLEPGERGDIEDYPLDPDTLKRCTISGESYPR